MGIDIFIRTELLRDLREVSLMGSPTGTSGDQQGIVAFSIATIPNIQRIRRQEIVNLAIIVILSLVLIFSDYFFLLSTYLFPFFLLVPSFWRLGQLAYDHLQVAAAKKLNRSNPGISTNLQGPTASSTNDVNKTPHDFKTMTFNPGVNTIGSDSGFDVSSYGLE
mmetsp:Transcript_7310/g.9265  ORF Transcript_7310/g.9265 Transcript_7310/m.9265 type:complete len:164 (+) Transcript_7310:2-493(+)